jgi:RNA polymerase primary sigma factor
MALAEALGRGPSDKELAMELGVPVNQVAHLKPVGTRTASLDAPIGDEGDSATFGEQIEPDERFRGIFEMQTGKN